MTKTSRSYFLAGLLCLAGLSTAEADVKLPRIFGNHMVLQQETALPVWGWADPGEKITVRLGDAKAEATAGADGKWQVDLPAVPVGTPPGTLVVAGRNTITIQDVLVGDVWVCSGQSNMALAPTKDHAAEMTDSQVRLFLIRPQIGVEQCNDVQGSWRVCSPEAVAGFTAVGGHFGNTLRPVLNRPIGLIGSYWGGTRAEAWTSLSALQANPALAHYAEDFNRDASNFPGGQAEYLAKFAAFNAAMQEWSKKLQADAEYQTAWKAWRAAAAQGKRTKQPEPPVPKPDAPKIAENTPSALFNGMIHPLIPYAIKGVIWYQGEGNAMSGNAAFDYRTLFSALIANWRSEWKQGDFPFLFVQLPNFRSPPKTAADRADWAILRESQLKALSLPKTGMAVTVDVGEGPNLHPKDKANVGRRLALAARHVAYGENLVYTGPIYQTMKADGGRIQISFRPDSVGGGLIIGGAPGHDGKLAPASETELRGFAVAGEEKKWVWADAKIEGATVVVSSPKVPNPVAVRYAWSDNPVCNLYNKEGLPASPFRTDEWNDFLSTSLSGGAQVAK